MVRIVQCWRRVRVRCAPGGRRQGQAGAAPRAFRVVRCGGAVVGGAAAALPVAILLWGAAARAAEADAPAGESATRAAPAATEAPRFAGEDLCRACHQEQADAYDATVHGRALGGESRPPDQRGCEACHGAGAAHVEAGGGKGVGGLEPFAPSRSATSRSTPCLRCHGDDAALFRVASSRHMVAGVACTDCHAGHRAAAEPLLRSAAPELCYGCHLQVRAEFALSERHRVGLGLVRCGDCHDTHGAAELIGLRETGNRRCLACHAEVEGPYGFEHAPVFGEGCTRCHVPHGGTNRHLLVRQQVAQLCYECHTVTPQDHLQPSFRDCTRCHVAIHGSNVSPLFLEQ